MKSRSAPQWLKRQHKKPRSWASPLMALQPLAAFFRQPTVSWAQLTFWLLHSDQEKR